MTYRWTGSHAYRDHANDRTIEPGEQLPEDSAERIASAHPYQVEEVDEEPSEDDAGDEEDVAAPPFETSELTVDEIEEGIANTDDIEALKAIRQSEADGEKRSTALEAIDDRLDELAE